MNRESPADLLRRKIEALQREEAITADPSQKFQIREQIKQAQADLDQLLRQGGADREVARPIRAVPKGLRSFDEGDKDFFLELLPGPYRPDGLPESIHFWKRQIEQRDADKTFRVGVIYGPSGCGKSSWVKAGLLPQLDSIAVVYLEATPGDTERGLLAELQKKYPELAPATSLQDALERMRNAPPSNKTLLVLDQFEQWLHGRVEQQYQELAEALDACDGAGVQCLLLVRSDYWTPLTLFLKRLGVRQEEGKNLAAVDTFDPRHARKVLTLFGQAYGALPDTGDLSAEQTEFLDRAIDGLAEDGRVICVRLALFAQMLKGRDWLPQTLRQVGGAAGVGFAFLEQSFVSKTAPATYRDHERAARNVLESLLPPEGSDIKGGMRPEQELLDRSSYTKRPGDLAALLEILDKELRLITPTSPPRPAADAEATQPPTSPAKHYQLTHDYLVPSLRRWLKQGREKTRRGRAELRLASRSELWSTTREDRQLPSAWEYLNIVSLVPSHSWTELQREMMRRAGRVRGLRWGSVLIVVLILGFIVQQVVSTIRLDNLSTRVEAATKVMENSRGLLVPRDIKDLDEFPLQMVHDKLSDRFDGSPNLALACALAHYDDVRLGFLVPKIETALPEDVDNIVTALGRAGNEAVDALRAAARVSDRQESDTQQSDGAKRWRYKARLAIVALHLGDTRLAQEMCELGPDPSQRTLFIDTFPAWYEDLRELKTYVADAQPGLRSGICLAIGSTNDVDSATKAQWKSLLSQWYADRPDTGTHSAAGWALRQWNLELPEIAPSSQPAGDNNWHVNRAGITMLKLNIAAPGRPAEFIMGSENGLDDETPHKVRLTQPFLLSDREVSRAQFEAFLADEEYENIFTERGNPIPKPAGWSFTDLGERASPSGKHPIQEVSWHDAAMFCNWLSWKCDIPEEQWCYQVRIDEQMQQVSAELKPQWWDLAGYRLPTEAEWEYACRAGTDTEYAFGDDRSLLAEYAVVGEESTDICGRKMPNGWGLFDMHGNVYEWCADWYDGGYYMRLAEADDVAVNPRGPHDAVNPQEPRVASARVFRGGCWRGDARYCRAAFRGWGGPRSRDECLGFRVAAVPPGKSSQAQVK